MTAKLLDAGELPEVREALRLLEPHLREASERGEAVVVRDGDSVVTVAKMQVRPWVIDDEMRRLAASPRFREMIAEARRRADQGTDLSTDELYRQLGITEEERTAARLRRERRRT